MSFNGIGAIGLANIIRYICAPGWDNIATLLGHIAPRWPVLLLVSFY